MRSPEHLLHPPQSPAPLVWLAVWGLLRHCCLKNVAENKVILLVEKMNVNDSLTLIKNKCHGEATSDEKLRGKHFSLVRIDNFRLIKAKFRMKK